MRTHLLVAVTTGGLCEVDGDELRVCGDGVDAAGEKNPEARRPKKFDSKEGLLLVFKREKKDAKFSNGDNVRLSAGD
jgi:hypothetical protein